MNTEKKNLFYSLIGVFIAGLIILSILTFLAIKPEKITYGFIIILLGAITLTILYIILWIISTRLIKGKALKYFINHKNLKQVERLGLKYNEKINGYSGNIKDYELTICCFFGEVELFSTDYVINIFFEPQSIEKFKEIKRTQLPTSFNIITEFIIQKVFSFKFFPPPYNRIKQTIEMLIETLERNNVKPISSEEIEKNIRLHNNTSA